MSRDDAPNLGLGKCCLTCKLSNYWSGNETAFCNKYCFYPMCEEVCDSWEGMTE
jgi:hypothetical protein